MQRQFAEYKDVMCYFITDARDKERFVQAYDGVDVIVHAVH